jgi:hypothetical protein
MLLPTPPPPELDTLPNLTYEPPEALLSVPIAAAPDSFPLSASIARLENESFQNKRLLILFILAEAFYIDSLSTYINTSNMNL